MKIQTKEHFNLEFSKGLLPWNPFALSTHHSIKEDRCSSALSLGTTGLLAQLQVLSLAPKPLSWAGWPACLCSFTPSSVLCQPAAATPHCSHFLKYAGMFMPPCLFPSCFLSLECCSFFPPRTSWNGSCSGRGFPRLLTRAHHSLHRTSPVPSTYLEYSMSLNVYWRIFISCANPCCRLWISQRTDCAFFITESMSSTGPGTR